MKFVHEHPVSSTQALFPSRLFIVSSGLNTFGGGGALQLYQ
jgi:hypothetical protein